MEELLRSTTEQKEALQDKIDEQKKVLKSLEAPLLKEEAEKQMNYAYRNADGWMEVSGGGKYPQW